MAQFFTSTSQTQEFVDSVDAFVLDCDGVLYSGPELIPHVAESIESLRKAGKRVSGPSLSIEMIGMTSIHGYLTSLSPIYRLVVLRHK